MIFFVNLDFFFFHQNQLSLRFFLVNYFLGQSFYGDAAVNDRNFKYKITDNIQDPLINDSLITSGKNVIHNLNKLIQHSSNDSYPLSVYPSVQ